MGELSGYGCGGVYKDIWEYVGVGASVHVGVRVPMQVDFRIHALRG